MAEATVERAPEQAQTRDARPKQGAPPAYKDLVRKYYEELVK